MGNGRRCYIVKYEYHGEIVTSHPYTDRRIPESNLRLNPIPARIVEVRLPLNRRERVKALAEWWKYTGRLARTRWETRRK